MAKRQTTATSRISVRYYLWSPEGPQRITERLHRELFEGNVTLPQLAGTKQKILEVFVKHLTSADFSLTARGIIYPFDAHGFLDDKRYLLEALPQISRFGPTQANVVDLEPSVKSRRFRAEYTWRPTRSMLSFVRADLERSGSRIAVLRPPTGRGRR